MIKRAIMISDDIAVSEEHMHYMLLAADWSRRRKKDALLQIKIVSCLIHGASENITDPEYLKRVRGVSHITNTTSAWPNTRLRNSGGHYPAFANSWGIMVHLAKKTGYPLPQNMAASGAGDWVPELDPELKDDKIFVRPFVFTRADADTYPEVHQAFKAIFDIAVACQNYCATRLEDFPEGTPFRRFMINRHPNRHLGSSTDGADIFHRLAFQTMKP